jgi:hypothetical protein
MASSPVIIDERNNNYPPIKPNNRAATNSFADDRRSHFYFPIKLLGGILRQIVIRVIGFAAYALALCGSISIRIRISVI